MPTREEAAAEKGPLDAKAAQHAAGTRSSTTFLSTDQLREAETAFQKLQPAPRSLLLHLDDGEGRGECADDNTALSRSG